MTGAYAAAPAVHRGTAYDRVRRLPGRRPWKTPDLYRYRASPRDAGRPIGHTPSRHSR
ncbi:hypothetical protein [Streptomyces sp. RKAG337]|uniref:hypothetical protein n=1 Tax=Streptomyces sp. RKAG337 TaxID=2893404 RepID=UPI0020342F36|nr:hypothetical protein [Streptomyces sp. RKAG337]MCM2429626.1 hypothetical protein [Streptomyces sp. RKAG337]